MGVVGDVLGYIGGSQDREAASDQYERQRADDLARENRNRIEVNNANFRARQDFLADQKVSRQDAFDFAQMGIRWRMADAEKAGIHPLMGLGGGSGMSGGGGSSPSVAVHQEGPGASPPYPRGGRDFAEFGQGLERSIMATRSKEERVMAALQLERGQLENDLLRVQIGQYGPPLPKPSLNINPMGDVGDVVVDPSRRVSSSPSRPSQEAGWNPDLAFARTRKGLGPVIPKSLSESYENDLVGSVLWAVRNRLMPNFVGGEGPSNAMLPKGAKSWRWHHGSQEWRPKFVSDDSTKQDILRYWGRK